jgi:hypothetical protein
MRNQASPLDRIALSLAVATLCMLRTICTDLHHNCVELSCELTGTETRLHFECGAPTRCFQAIVQRLSPKLRPQPIGLAACDYRSRKTENSMPVINNFNWTPGRRHTYSPKRARQSNANSCPHAPDQSAGCAAHNVPSTLSQLPVRWCLR